MMTLEEKQNAYREDVLEQADSLRFVGRKAKKVIGNREKLGELATKYSEVEFDFDGYDYWEGEWEWLRLNTNDVYLYIRHDGSEEYQLDPYSGCGGEWIVSHSYDEFVKAVTDFSFPEDEWNVFENEYGYLLFGE